MEPFKRGLADIAVAGRFQLDGIVRYFRTGKHAGCGEHGCYPGAPNTGGGTSRAFSLIVGVPFFLPDGFISLFERFPVRIGKKSGNTPKFYAFRFGKPCECFGIR
jgi:hypothetical protein